MILETNRLILRMPKIEDSKDLVESLTDSVLKYLSRIPKLSKETAEIAIGNALKKMEGEVKSCYTFHIENKGSHKMIGVIMINNINYDNKSCQLVYWLNEKYHRKGFMTEAIKKILDFCFNELKLSRAEMEVYADNTANNFLAKKLKFNLEEVKKRASKCKSTGIFHDCNIYAIVPSLTIRGSKDLSRK